jgi:[lysine-biosynthesis-protein LysW]--L-2-aminoadipate ligase
VDYGDENQVSAHEMNATCEFEALNAAVPDVDVPARIVDWLEARAAE